jgi:hypothetical protein
MQRQITRQVDPVVGLRRARHFQPLQEPFATTQVRLSD